MPRPRRDCIDRTQVKKAKKKEEIRIAREKAEKRIAAALEANNAKQRRKREVFDAKQVEVGKRRPTLLRVVPTPSTRLVSIREGAGWSFFLF